MLPRFHLRGGEGMVARISAIKSEVRLRLAGAGQGASGMVCGAAF